MNIILSFAKIMLLALGLLFSLHQSNAQVGIATDINTSGNSYPEQLIQLGDVLYFAANDGSHGSELYQYQPGVGASLVADIYSGASNSDITEIALYGDSLYFPANDGVNGIELWKYHSSTGAVLVADIYDGAESSNPTSLTVYQDTLYFAADDGDNGLELFKYHPSIGVSLTEDIDKSRHSSSVAHLIVFGDTLYFTADDGDNGQELYQYHPNTGVALAADIYDGASGSKPEGFVLYHDTLFFAADDGTHGIELYKFHPETGAELVSDIYDGIGSATLSEFIIYNDILYFQADDGTLGAELYNYHPNTGGVLVADIYDGASGAVPQQFATYGNKLYFSAEDETHGQELYQYHPSTGAELVADIWSGFFASSPIELVVMGDTLYFNATDATYGSELWKYSADVTAPSITSSTPADDSVGVATISTMEIKFDEDILLASAGTISLYDVTNDVTFVSYDLSETTTELSVTDSTLTVSPSTNFSEEVVYALQMTEGAIEDAIGNLFAGIGDNTSLNFTTADETALTLVASSPSHESTNVPMNTTIELKFDDDILLASTGVITIYDVTNDATFVSYDLSETTTELSIADSTLSIDPSTNFSEEVQYVIQISSGAILDDGGNAFSGITDGTSLYFTTTGITFELPSSIVVYENSATTELILDAEASNNGGAADEDISYSLAGDDASLFAITEESGLLYFTAVPDWDNPTDTDRDNVYEVNIIASESSASLVQSVKIFVVPEVEDGLGIATQKGQDIDGEAYEDYSGSSVSISADGKVVAIGAVGNDGNGSFSGHVRVYAYEGTVWTQLGADIDGERQGDWSGGAVSLSADGMTVAIGASSNNGNGSYAGHVRVYAFDGIAWVQQGADIDGEAEWDQSGEGVSLSADGNTVAIGAIRNDGGGNNAGHVRVYDFDGTSWHQLGADIDGEAEWDQSGEGLSLSADGNTVAIASVRNSDNGNYAGHVRVFSYDGTAWVQQGADIDGEAENDNSGSSVSLSADGKTIAIGAEGHDSYTGQVRVFEFDGTEWIQQGAGIDGEAENDWSGASVSLSADGSIVAIGAPYHDGNATDAGHVRIYAYDGNTWTQVGTGIDGEAEGDYSSVSMSLSADGTTVAIGAESNYGSAHGTGHVRVYDLKALAISDSYPTDNAMNVVRDTVISIHFNKQIQLSSSVSIIIYDLTNTTTFASYDQNSSELSVTDSTLIISPSTSFDIYTEYAVLISSGAITDLFDVAFEGVLDDNTLNFTTKGVVFDLPSSTVVYENVAATELILEADATDNGGAADENIVYSLSGEDAALFSITQDDGVLYFAESPDWDIPADSNGDNVYEINITASSDVTSSSLTQSVNVFVAPEVEDVFDVATLVGTDIDGEASLDYSGYAVSLSADGSIVAIGAYGNDANGSSAGHVRVYAYDGTAWAQQGEDIEGEAAGDYSGRSVTLSADGSILAIGAIGNDENGDASGHVRVYAFDGTTWVQQGEDIDGEAADDYSGKSVSLSADGSTLAIGAYENDGNGEGSGHVRVYTFDGTTWVQQGEDIDGEAANDWSGASVSLNADGSTVAIGAYENDGNGDAAGHVRVYTFDGTTWIQQGTDIDGEAAGDESGYAISLSADGNTLAIGARKNDGTADEAGHVRVYAFDGVAWGQQGADIEGEAAGDQSGHALSLSADGSTLAIGARYNDENGDAAGHVRIYAYNGTAWVLQGIDIDGEAAGDESGYALSLSADGSFVAIGARYNDENGDAAGHVRVYALKDISPPSITSSTPAHDSVGVETTSTIEIKFDDDIALATTGTIVLYDVTNNTTFIRYDLSETNADVTSTDSSLTITPSTDFSEKVVYAIQVTEGAIEDESGNPFAGIDNNTTLSFTTEGGISVTSDEIPVPEIFTPNSDGLNDILEIEGISNYPSNHVVIFNRYGQKMFEASPYLNESGWDGTIHYGMIGKGKQAENGVYFYIFDKGDGSKIQKKYIHLER